MAAAARISKALRPWPRCGRPSPWAVSTEGTPGALVVSAAAAWVSLVLKAGASSVIMAWLAFLHMHGLVIALRLRRRISRTTPTVDHAEDRGDESECGDGGTQQAANHGAPERRILLAAIPQPQRHGDHADDHGQGGHEHRPKAREARLDGGLQRVAVV